MRTSAHASTCFFGRAGACAAGCGAARTAPRLSARRHMTTSRIAGRTSCTQRVGQTRGFAQRKRDDLRAGRRSEEAATAGRDDDILASVLARRTSSESNGRSPRAWSPTAVFRTRVECAEPLVHRRADEDHAAGGDDAAADVERAGVLSKPFAFSSSTKPSGTFHAISPLLTSTATSSPKGGAEHGILFCGFQKRPTGAAPWCRASPRRRAALAPDAHLHPRNLARCRSRS